MDEVIGATKNRPLARRAVKRNGWTKARRAAFLGELAQSCNVSRAAAAAGMSFAACYRLRQRDTGFADTWHEALVLGYERLEMALVRRALQVVDDLPLDDTPEVIDKMTVAQAMDVMARHRATVMNNRGKDRRQTRHIATQEETDTVLLRRIDMVLKQRAREAARGDDGPSAEPDATGEGGD